VALDTCVITGGARLVNPSCTGRVISNPRLRLTLTTILSGSNSQFAAKDFVHPCRTVKANVPGNRCDGSVRLGEFALGTLDSHATDLGCDRAVEVLAKAALQGSQPNIYRLGVSFRQACKIFAGAAIVMPANWRAGSGLPRLEG